MTDENKKPINFDWVEARQKCSLQDVFEALRLGIRADVKKRNENLPDNPDPDRPTLKVAERGPTIRVYWHDVYRQYQDFFVEFTLTLESISVKNSEGLLFDATIGLNDDGDCKVNIFGKQYDLWQVQRKALEPVLFKTI